jgi:hypothetical protein
MTPETNSTNFVLATTLQTENHPIVDWRNRNRVNSSLENVICLTSSELHCREVVQCSATLGKSIEHIPSNLLANFLSKEFLYYYSTMGAFMFRPSPARLLCRAQG